MKTSRKFVESSERHIILPVCLCRYCDVITATGAYSCLRVDLVFARELSFYIVTIYVPCFMIVVVSWFSFWLDYKAVIPIKSTFISTHI